MSFLLNEDRHIIKREFIMGLLICRLKLTFFHICNENDRCAYQQIDVNSAESLLCALKGLPVFLFLSYVDLSIHYLWAFIYSLPIVLPVHYLLYLDIYRYLYSIYETIYNNILLRTIIMLLLWITLFQIMLFL